jgi:cytochrome P450
MYDASPQRAKAASNRSPSTPVSPRGYPLVGHLPLMRDLLGAAVQFRSLGDIVKLRLPPHDVFVLSHPRDIEQWLVGDHASYRKDWTTRALTQMLGQGLFVNEGSRWLKQRRIVQLELSPRRLEPQFADLQSCVDRALARLLTECSAPIAPTPESAAEAQADTSTPAETAAVPQTISQVPDKTETADIPPAEPVVADHTSTSGPLPIGPVVSGTLVRPKAAPSEPPQAHQSAVYPRVETSVAPAGAARPQMDPGGADGPVHNLYGLMLRLSLDLASSTLFGPGCEAQTRELAAMLDDLVRHHVSMLGQGRKLPDWVPTRQNRRTRKHLARLHSVLTSLIDVRRKAETPGTDLLSRLIQARDDRGRAMPTRLLADEAISLLLAGYETTALLLTCSLMEVSRHADTERRLLRELEEHAADAAGQSLSALDRLPYLDAVVREALRLYPSAYAIGREALVDTRIGDCPIPRGAQVWAFQWAIQRDPRFFHQPDRFRPERWIHGETTAMPRFAYFPFAGGPRACPGAPLAMMEAKMVLATLLPKLRFHLLQDEPPLLVPGFSLRPRDGVPVIIRQR